MAEGKAKQARQEAASGRAAKDFLEADPPDAITLGALSQLDVRKLGLASVPSSLGLCRRLVKLDLGDNPLLKVPDLVAELPCLEILFASGVDMKEVPLAVHKCEKLHMVGFRNNQIASLNGACFPQNLAWLIAAGNQIREMPNISRLQHIRKLMLSHNRLTCAGLAPVAEIPALEMLRVAGNCLEAFPKALLRHPRLAWVAVGGNPFAEAALEKRLHGAPPLVDFKEVSVGEKLGSGAGATVYRGSWRGRVVAVKLWDQETFSDGSAKGEWSINLVASAPGHRSIIGVLGAFSEPRMGMILELLENAVAAAGPPTPASVTRDSPPSDGRKLDSVGALKVAEGVALAGAYLHSRGLTHADIYLHNTLIITEPVPRGGPLVSVRDVRLSDFGGATAVSDDEDGRALQRLELRSFGWLLQDLLDLCMAAPAPEEADAVALLQDVRARCAQEDVERLPKFADLAVELSTFLHGHGSGVAPVGAL